MTELLTWHEAMDTAAEWLTMDYAGDGAIEMARTWIMYATELRLAGPSAPDLRVGEVVDVDTIFGYRRGQSDLPTVQQLEYALKRKDYLSPIVGRSATQEERTLIDEIIERGSLGGSGLCYCNGNDHIYGSTSSCVPPVS